MRVTRFESVGEFRERATPFLLEHEAANNLILGISASVADGSARYEGPLYFATVDDGGAVIAAAVRTPPYSIVLSVAPAEVTPLIAADILAISPDLPGVNGTSNVSHAFAEAIRVRSGRRFALARAMRIHELQRVIPVHDIPGQLRRATLADRDIVLAWSRSFSEETSGAPDDAADARALDMLGDAGDRAMYLWHDGGPVSMCGFSGPTPNGIRVSYVYTPPHLRGRGYASAAVAELSQHILDSGRRFCFLYTDLRNPTSNRIYQRIGYEPVIDVDEYAFEPAST